MKRNRAKIDIKHQGLSFEKFGTSSRININNSNYTAYISNSISNNELAENTQIEKNESVVVNKRKLINSNGVANMFSKNIHIKNETDTTNSLNSTNSCSQNNIELNNSVNVNEQNNKKFDIQLKIKQKKVKLKSMNKTIKSSNKTDNKADNINVNNLNEANCNDAEHILGNNYALDCKDAESCVNDKYLNKNHSCDNSNKFANRQKNKDTKYSNKNLNNLHKVIERFRIRTETKNAINAVKLENIQASNTCEMQNKSSLRAIRNHRPNDEKNVDNIKNHVNIDASSSVDNHEIISDKKLNKKSLNCNEYNEKQLSSKFSHKHNTRNVKSELQANKKEELNLSGKVNNMNHIGNNYNNLSKSGKKYEQNENENKFSNENEENESMLVSKKLLKDGKNNAYISSDNTNKIKIKGIKQVNKCNTNIEGEYNNRLTNKHLKIKNKCVTNATLPIDEFSCNNNEQLLFDNLIDSNFVNNTETTIDKSNCNISINREIEKKNSKEFDSSNLNKHINADNANISCVSHESRNELEEAIHVRTQNCQRKVKYNTNLNSNKYNFDQQSIGEIEPRQTLIKKKKQRNAKQQTKLASNKEHERVNLNKCQEKSNENSATTSTNVVNMKNVSINNDANISVNIQNVKNKYINANKALDNKVFMHKKNDTKGQDKQVGEKKDNTISNKYMETTQGNYLCNSSTQNILVNKEKAKRNKKRSKIRIDELDMDKPIKVNTRCFEQNNIANIDIHANKISSAKTLPFNVTNNLNCTNILNQNVNPKFSCKSEHIYYPYNKQYYDNKTIDYIDQHKKLYESTQPNKQNNFHDEQEYKLRNKQIKNIHNSSTIKYDSKYYNDSYPTKSYITRHNNIYVCGTNNNRKEPSNLHDYKTTYKHKYLPENQIKLQNQLLNVTLSNDNSIKNDYDFCKTGYRATDETLIKVCEKSSELENTTNNNVQEFLDNTINASQPINVSDISNNCTQIAINDTDDNKKQNPIKEIIVQKIFYPIDNEDEIIDNILNKVDILSKFDNFSKIISAEQTVNWPIPTLLPSGIVIWDQKDLIKVRNLPECITKENFYFFNSMQDNKRNLIQDDINNHTQIEINEQENTAPVISNIDSSKATERNLRALLNKLNDTNKDEIFNKIVTMLTGIEELKTIVMLIFNKACSQHRYISLYADLTIYIHEKFENKELFQTDKTSFKHLLFDQVQKTTLANKDYKFVNDDKLTEEEQFEQLQKIKVLMKGNMVFIAELYIRNLINMKVARTAIYTMLEGNTEIHIETVVYTLSMLHKMNKDKNIRIICISTFEKLLAEQNISTRLRYLISDYLENTSN